MHLKHMYKQKLLLSLVNSYTVRQLPKFTLQKYSCVLFETANNSWEFPSWVESCIDVSNS